MAKTPKPNTAENSTTPGKERTTLYMRGDVLKKIKFIALIEEQNQTETIDKALNEFVDRWEKKNGPLPIKA